MPPAGTRPTSDRVREALFSAVGARIDLEGARVLDLYAGSGALGLEALSRGAAHALLVESNRRAATVLRGNVTDLGLPGAQVVLASVGAVLAAGPVDPHDPTMLSSPTRRTHSPRSPSPPTWPHSSRMVGCGPAA